MRKTKTKTTGAEQRKDQMGDLPVDKTENNRISIDMHAAKKRLVFLVKVIRKGKTCFYFHLIKKRREVRMKEGFSRG